MSSTYFNLARSVAVLFLGLCGPALLAQEPWDASFFEEIEVRMTNIEVFVRDHQGNAVEGLELEDFEVLEDGRPVELTNFYASSSPGTTPGRPAAAAGPAATEQRLAVVLFFDLAHLAPRNRDRAVARLREASWFKPELGDRVMVIGQRRTQSLEVVQALTQDRAQFLAALDRIAALPAGGDQRRRETEGALHQLLDPRVGAAEDSTNPEKVLAALRPVFEAEYARVRSTLETLERFVDAFTALPGRKALVYLSDGLPLRPGEAVAASMLGPQRGTELADLDTTALWRRLGQRANSNRVTFYPVLAGGGTPEDFFAPALGPDPRPEERTRRARAAAVQKANLRTPLRILAESTGGLAFLQPKTFERAMARLRQDFSSYYSLGYQAPRPADGQSHRLEVRLRRPERDLVLRHRQGYRDKDPQDAMADRTLSALFFGTQDDNPLGVKLALSPRAKKDSSESYRLTVEVKIPISRLLLLPEDTFHEAQVSIFVGTRDAAGHTGPIKRLPTPIRIPNDQLLTSLNQMATYPVDLYMLDASDHTVVVGVRDEIAARESTMRVAVRPGS